MQLESALFWRCRRSACRQTPTGRRSSFFLRFSGLPLPPSIHPGFGQSEGKHPRILHALVAALIAMAVAVSATARPSWASGTTGSRHWATPSGIEGETIAGLNDDRRGEPVATTSSVSVQTDKRIYTRGSRITVTIHNRTPYAIVAPVQALPCAFVRVQKRRHESWEHVDGGCSDIGPVRRIEIGPSESLRGWLHPEARSVWALSHEPRSLEPRTAESASVQPSPGPTSPPPPEGVRPPGPLDPLFHTLRASLDTGTYRILFAFTAEPDVQPRVQTRSAEIVIE